MTVSISTGADAARKSMTVPFTHGLSKETTPSSYVSNKTVLFEVIEVFKKDFIDEAKALYPAWDDLHRAIEIGSGMIDRYLDDSTPTGIGYREILAATSLEELKKKALVIKRKNDLFESYRSGSCYQTESDRRECAGCPRAYAQMADDAAALDAFQCYGVFHIPDCPKFRSGECWRKFDSLGLKMK